MAKKGKTKQPFWLGGAASSMACCFTHPMDQTKYRMQVQSSKEHMLRVMRRFAIQDGIPSLWTGISASVLRQTTYSTTRFGLYNYLARSLKQFSGKAELSPASTMACAGISGGIAGLVGNPTEVVLVRMCTDGVKRPEQMYKYNNALKGLIRIGREEGLKTFTKGLGPNVIRSVLMNVSQIAVYTSAKANLLSATYLNLEDGVPVHILASLTAGTVATTVCAPADVLKSRAQSAATIQGKRVGILQIIKDSLKKEGPGFLMKGWTPAWMRLAPNTILMFIFMEQLQKLVDHVA